MKLIMKIDANGQFVEPNCSLACHSPHYHKQKDVLDPMADGFGKEQKERRTTEEGCTCHNFLP